MRTSAISEKAAPAKLQIPLTEKLKSIPEVFGIRLNEEPTYQVLKQDHAFEIRRYPNQLLARVTLHGLPFDQFREQAFQKLAAYIFGGNKPKMNVPMTSPVLEARAAKDSQAVEIPMTSPVLEEQTGLQDWTMSFILPAKFYLQNAPQPLDPAVSLEESRGYDAAVIRYSGNNNLERIQAHEIELDQWISAQPQIQKIGKAFAAQYDAPFVLPFFKRNEIHVKIAGFRG